MYHMSISVSMSYFSSKIFCRIYIFIVSTFCNRYVSAIFCQSGPENTLAGNICSNQADTAHFISFVNYVEKG